MGRYEKMSSEEEIEAMLRWGDRLVDGRESSIQRAGATPDQQSPEADLTASFTPVRGRGDSAGGSKQKSAARKANKAKRRASINSRKQKQRARISPVAIILITPNIQPSTQQCSTREQ